MSRFFRRVGASLVALLVGGNFLTAQNYDEMWKKVEESQKKDLPKATIELVNGIYNEAKRQGNTPQILKAYLTRAECQTGITPDSLAAEVEGLKTWLRTEQDPTGKAVISNLLGSITLDINPANLDSATAYFAESVADKDLLYRTSAKKYKPLAESGKISEHYLADNLLDLLTRQAIREVESHWYAEGNARRDRFVATMWKELADYYAQQGDRRAWLLTRLSQINDLRQQSSNSPTRPSDEEIVQTLEKIKADYAGTEGCAAVYAAIATFHHDKQDYEQEMATIEAGLTAYPQSAFAPQLRDMRQSLLQPALSVSLPYAYPSKEVKLSVRHRNLDGFTWEMYRLNLAPTSPYLSRSYINEGKLIEQYGQLALRKHFSLRTTPDYKEASTQLSVRLPKAGIYIMKCTPDGGKGKAGFDVVYLSPYQIVSFPASPDKIELYVVDKDSGSPVPNAKIVLYDFKQGKYTASRTYRTDTKGKALLPNEDGRRLGYVNAMKGETDCMQPSYFYGNGIAQNRADKQARKHIALFTDRAIYRPGQTIHVSGVAYCQKGDSVETLRGITQTLTLKDANRQEIARKEIRTDDFGSFDASFGLPESVLPGDFSLSTVNGSTYFSVQEYKRPTFFVEIPDYEKPYNVGDTLRIEGTAKNFSGAAVQDAAVRYTVSRAKRSFWRFDQNYEVIAQADTVTDTNGKFALNVCLQKAYDYDASDSWNCYYIYKVYAEIRNAAGETQSTQAELPTGKKSVMMRVVGLPQKVACEKSDTIAVQMLNLLWKPIDTNVDISIRRPAPDGSAGETLLSKTVASNKSFVWNEMRNLPAGKYIFAANAKDAFGRSHETTQEFILFSLHGKSMPVDTVQWFYQDGSEFVAGKTVDIYVGSSEPNVHLFYDVYAGNKRIESQRLILNNEIRQFSFDYKEEYGDGIGVLFAFVREGILYSKRVELTRPQPEKELILKWNVFRDQLVPGQKEAWSLSVSDKAGKPVDARLLATLYDASLDKLLANNWIFNLYFNRHVPYTSANLFSGNGYSMANSEFKLKQEDGWFDLYGAGGYSRINIPRFSPYIGRFYGSSGRTFRRNMLMTKATAAMPQASFDMAETDATADGFAEDRGMNEVFNSIEEHSVSIDDATDGYQPLRENFTETAFFYPALRTDSTGVAHIAFTVPDALTEWRFIGFAHTRDMHYGLIKGKAKTSKQFMVQPNMPRFVRQGDRNQIAVSLINLSDKTIEGNLNFKLYDPLSEDVFYDMAKPFAVAKGETAVIRFECEIPDGYELLVCRTQADAGTFSDGEQHYLPVLSDKQRVTETVSIQMEGSSMASVDASKLFNNGSKSADNHRLTVEMTANPAWYAIQALPSVGEPKYDNALSWAVAYYANSLAKLLIEQNPKIAEAFKALRASSPNGKTFDSTLASNQELKNLILEQSPWLLDATDETTRMRDIAELFDDNNMRYRTDKAVTALERLQRNDGQWAWFDGLRGNQQVTLQVAEMTARLKSKGVALGQRMEKMYAKALQAIAYDFTTEYQLLKEADKRLQPRNPSPWMVCALYVCAIDKQAMDAIDKAARSYAVSRLENRSAEYDIYEKALIATIMQSAGKHEQATTLVRSIKEYTVCTDEMGRYFDTPKAAYSWHDYRIPTEVAAMEAIKNVQPDTKMLDEMRKWLLKQKQVQAWETPLATADALYALFFNNSSLLATDGKMTATIADKQVSTPDNALGYVRQTFAGDDAKAKNIAFQRKGEGMGWANVYAQYDEDIDKIGQYEGKGLKIERELWASGKKLSGKSKLRIGDKITVRLIIKTDRDMDFVHIKDQRAACMEPAEQLSGTISTPTAIYYRVIRDASTEFFADRLSKGLHIIEYDIYIDRAGAFHCGTATVQSAYAPEFGSHTSGKRLSVTE